MKSKKLSLLIICLTATALFAGCGVKDDNKSNSDKEGTAKETVKDTSEKETTDDNQKDTPDNNEKGIDAAEADKNMCDTIKATMIAASTNEDALSELVKSGSGSFDLTSGDAISLPDMPNLEMELKEVLGEMTPPKTEGMTKYHVSWTLSEDGTFPKTTVELQP